MNAARPVSAALVGIDGSGKSTVAHLVGTRMGPRCAVMSCLRNHEMADAPLHNLSTALDRLSKEADVMGSQRFKLAALYLQMCMFGPTERFVAQAVTPLVVLSDRHPIVDAAVYLPLFRQMIESSGDAADVSDWLGRITAAERDLVTAWASAQGRRLGGAIDLGTVALDLIALTHRGIEPLMDDIAMLLQACLPDFVIWLDIDVDQALHRIDRRARPRELHETRQRLLAVHKGYERVLGALTARLPVHRILVGEQSPADVADVVAELLAKEGCCVHTGTSAA
jgi:thymidylate kinase